MDQETVELQWIRPESEKDAQVRAIELAGGTVDDSGGTYRPAPDELADYPAAGFEPLTMIVVAATAVFVVQALTRTWRDRNVHGGIVLDTRGPNIKVRRVPGMTNGQLVVVESGQTRVFDRQQENEGLEVLRGVCSRSGK